MQHVINSKKIKKIDLSKPQASKEIQTAKKPKTIDIAKDSIPGTMKYGSLIMEKRDFVTILRQWNMTSSIENYSHKDALDILKANMVEAIVLNSEDMPIDVIRLYSWVTVSSGSGWRETFQLVLPTEENVNNDMISVQSSLGATIIGYAEGDQMKFGTPIGIIPLKMECVEQSGGYIKAHIKQDEYEKLLSERQKAFLTEPNLESSTNKIDK